MVFLKKKNALDSVLKQKLWVLFLPFQASNCYEILSFESCVTHKVIILNINFCFLISITK